MQYLKFEENTEFHFNRRSGNNIKNILSDSHYHNLFEIYYISNGFCRYFIDGKLYDLTEGDIILIPGGVIHNTEYRDTPHTRLLINCSERFIPSSKKRTFAKTFVDLCHLLWYVCVAEKVNTNLGDENL